MYVFIYLVMSVYLEIAAQSAYDMFSLCKYIITNLFSFNFGVGIF